MLNSSNVQKMSQLSQNPYFNCWGATQHALGVQAYPKWIELSDMDDFLAKFTKPVTGKLKKGDILVIRNPKYGEYEGLPLELVHTATYVGGFDSRYRWFHKCGEGIAEYTTKKGASLYYSFYTGNNPNVEVRRFMQKKYKQITEKKLTQ